MSAPLPYNVYDYELGNLSNRKDIPPLKWNPDGSVTVNAHALICGMSGAGKTTLLLDLVNYLNDLGKHIYIFDLQGNMKIHNKNGELIGNYIEFTAWDSKYGISIFDFDTGVHEKTLNQLIDGEIELDDKLRFQIQNSGPKVQVENILEIFKKNFYPNMGEVQRDMFINLIEDTYRMRGFIYNDYHTWNNELPSFNDTLELIDMIKKHHGKTTKNEDDNVEAFVDRSIPLIVELKNLKKRQSEDSEEDKEELKKLTNKNESQLREAFDNYVNSGLEDYSDNTLLRMNSLKWFKERGIDFTRYESKEAIRTVEKLLSFVKRIVDSGLFHDKRPPVKSGLNIINISGLNVTLQKFFVDIWLAKVFKSCKIRGDYKSRKDKSRGAKVDTYVIVDESKLIVGNAKEKTDPYSFLNRIATESRNVGLGIIVAAQSAEHYPPEFLKNFHLQIILKTGVADAETVRKAFNVKKEELDYTNKFANALVKNGNNFNQVVLKSLKEAKEKWESQQG